MPVLWLRRLIQFGSLLLIFMIPIYESYKSILYHIPKDSIGNLYQEGFGSLDSFLKGGYLEPGLLLLDGLVGLLFNNIHAVKRFLDGFSGFFWSITIGGFSFVDPLASLQVPSKEYSWDVDFLISITLPILIALVFGRVFCSWICPYNTLQELIRFVAKKLGVSGINKQVLTDHYLRYCILGIGFVLTVLGVAVFPYILPYVQLGRIFYYLTLRSIFWVGLIFVIVLLLVDSFVQKGFWCNYLCTTGALLSLLGRKKFVTIQRDKKVCLESCTLCEKVCVWDSHPKFDDVSNCTHCHLCINQCPSKALKIRS
ncbi:4Fe-4S binding protein [Desulfitobacterium sp. THU1]|uniref:4Fe-4S binding protein n=1 Tax=Desulfitobacterium sp. THU1 TaxID=3138072 RepID=UPI003120028B